MAALLSLLDKKKGIVPLTSVELIQVVLKNIKKQRGKNESARCCS